MNNRRVFRWILLALTLLAPTIAPSATLQVGPGQQYATPCAAIAAALAGDTILIDAAGTYTGDVCIWYQDGLTLRGVNGRPHIDANGENAAGKGIWVVDGNNTTIDNIEFSGATVPDGNGAGVRGEGLNLTVRNCYFHNNQDGILTNDNQGGQILIEYSEFAYNGVGNGYTHNIYIGSAAKFTLQFSYSHHAYSGQLVKSRAAETHLLYNRLTTESGNTSFEIDISNGGLTYIVGNLVHQGVNGQNGSVLAYMLEGTDAFHPSQQLFLVNNTFVNDLSYGIFLNISSSVGTPAIVTNNIFYGAGTLSTQASAVLSGNYTGANPMFVNQAGYDYHLQAGSPAINTGTTPGTGAGVSLNPDYEYVHPTCGESRITQGVIDIGAYEYGGAGAAVACASGGGTAASPPPTGSATSIWSSSAVPGNVFVTAASPLTLGVKFRSDVAGSIKGIRFYKGAGNNGTHIGMLYTSTGTLLGQATFSGETASGWQEADFASPVAIAANTIYVAAFFTTSGCADDSGYFAAKGVDSAPLHALQSGVNGWNGVYVYSNSPQFPAMGYDSANYWVDVAFTPSASSSTPLALACPSGTAQLGVPYSSALTGSGGTTPYNYSIASNALPGGLTLSGSTGAITGAPTAAGIFSFTAKLTDAAATSVVSSCSINVSTVSGATGSGVSTIWPSSAAPGNAFVSPASPLTLGVKFRSDVAGSIKGIRFYKGAGNNGTHIGMLYTSTGTLLGQATFSGETASGWQEADFTSPVAIAANTIYVAAFFTTSGCADDSGYFTAKGVDSAPLHALQSGVNGWNGVYVYSNSPQFPAMGYDGANYWVDVAFTGSN